MQKKDENITVLSKMPRFFMDCRLIRFFHRLKKTPTSCIIRVGIEIDLTSVMITITITPTHIILKSIRIGIRIEYQAIA